MQTAVNDSISVNYTDSVGALAAVIMNQPVSEPNKVSLFINHELQASGGLDAIELVTYNSEFVFAVLGLCAALLVYLHRNSDGVFSSVFKGSFDMNLALQESRLDNSQRSRNMLILLVISALVLSLFFTRSIGFFKELEPTGSNLFFQVFFGLITFVSLKKGIQWVLANLFQLNGVLKSYSFNSNILTAITGLSILPVCLLLFFSPQIPTNILVYSSLVVIGFFYLKSVQRGVQIAMTTNSVSPLHLFYYLCALEILPVFVLIRIVLGG